MELSAHICKHTNNLLQTLPLKKGDLQRIFLNVQFCESPSRSANLRGINTPVSCRDEPLSQQDCRARAARRTGCPLSHKELELQGLLEEIVLLRGGNLLVSIIPISLLGAVPGDSYTGLTILYTFAGSCVSLFLMCLSTRAGNP